MKEVGDLRRILDILISLGGLIVASPLMALLFVAGWRDTGSPLLRQERVGRYKRPFVLLKFRTMPVGTPHVPTHLVTTPILTPLGRYLRRSKLDELPQLWNVLWGEMSLVGPRPCLTSQTELIRLRDQHGIFDVRPGITGLAQVSGIDMSDPYQLTELDAQFIQEATRTTYFYLLWVTITGRGKGDYLRV